MHAMELAAARHGCKVCGKSFPCGRSLGGHMRSHLSLCQAAAEADVDDEVKRDSASFNRSSSNGVVGYGLREHPRKTRRLSDFADEEEEEEDYCGDGNRDGERKECRQCGKLFGSWRSLFGHMRSHASGGRDRDEEEEEFIPEEAEELMEAPAPVAVLAAAPRRRRRTMRVAAPAPAQKLPVLSGFEKEQEDVALCLLMLSRDTGLWSSPIKEGEPFFEKESDRKNATKKQARLPQNGYDYNSDEDSALLQYGGARIKTGGVAKIKTRKRSSLKQQQCQAPAPKRTRYECPGCGKVFGSYQALGGHRASHKRINTSCSAPKPAAAPVAAPEPSAETHTSHSTLSPSASPDSVPISIGGGDDMVSGKAKASTAVVEKFECPIRSKAFASGQALGGHKRSHMLDDGGLYDAGEDQEERHAAAAAGFLDLNFPPAPAEEA